MINSPLGCLTSNTRVLEISHVGSVSHQQGADPVWHCAAIRPVFQLASITGASSSKRYRYFIVVTSLLLTPERPGVEMTPA